MVKFTTTPGVTFYVINAKTNRMLSFGAIEMASTEIFGLRNTKVPTLLIIIKNTPDGAKVVNLKDGTVAQIESQLAA